MADLKVIELHPGPGLNDIPEQLRSLADRVEAGEYGGVASLLAVMPREQDYPIIFGWGEVHGGI